jgi:hypothetical protein
MWLTWIDDCIAIGKKSVVERESAQLMSLFDCDDVGSLMKEYIGNNIEIGDGMMKLMQPVLLKSFDDEFEVSKTCQVNLPAKAGQVLMKGKEDKIMSNHMMTKYRSRVGKLRYLATWSRPDILNAVREASRLMKAPTQVHYQAMIQIMEYCVTMSKRGRKIAPKENGTEPRTLNCSDGLIRFDIQSMSRNQKECDWEHHQSYSNPKP